MMDYRIDTMPGHWFKLVESKTDQVIKTFTMYSEAKKMLRHLNLGGGFDGWTPQFFLKKIPENLKNSDANV